MRHYTTKARAKLAENLQKFRRTIQSRYHPDVMIYAFAGFEVDTSRAELRAGETAVPIEPQVFALLSFLLENRDRMVTKEEIVQQVWNGRFITDATIASRIKSARQALGDDGREQRLIRTVHGRGFRFLADVAVTAPTRITTVAERDGAETPATRIQSTRPSIAVLPFRLLGDAGTHFVIADALPQDLITELSRLHWLFVIARASSFCFRGADADPAQVRTALGVRYCLSGGIEIQPRGMTVSVELCDTDDRSIVWSERFQATVDATHDIRAQIARAVLAALEYQIPRNEARRAQWQAPGQLDAWAAYHLGLQRMYRFNKADNAAATAYFERAVSLEPEFARAYAGLSFTHFQNAFLQYSDPQEAARLAQHYAEQCWQRDPEDPFGNFTMGRAYWLRGDLDGSLPWLERANKLNPNYAHARYSRAWTLALLGSADECRSDVDAALALSPLDTFLYGMLGVRALSHLVREEFREAASWAVQAARSPGAHVLIEMIASATCHLSGDDTRAAAWARSARARQPGFKQADFFAAFPFREQRTRACIGGALERCGF